MGAWLRGAAVALLVTIGLVPAAAAQRQIVGGTTTIVFSPEYIAYVEQFASGFPPVSVFGTATMPDSRTVVLPLAVGPYLPGIGYVDTDANYAVFQHGGSGFTLLAEGVAYVFDPLIALGELAGTDFSLGAGVNFLFGGIAVGDGITVPPAPSFSGPIFTFPQSALTGALNGNVLTVSNMLFSINDDGALGALGVIATATSQLQLAAVPEPETWALMLIGFGLAGVVSRRQLKRMTPLPTSTAVS